MKKIIALSSVCLLALVLTVSFKTNDSDTKEYVAIYYNSIANRIVISESNGEYKEIKPEKNKGMGDQTQVFNKINEFERAGYKLSKYQYESHQPKSKEYYISVLMSK